MKITSLFVSLALGSTVLAADLPKPTSATITLLCSELHSGYGDGLEVEMKKVDRDSNAFEYLGQAQVGKQTFVFKYDSYFGLTIETTVAGNKVSANGNSIFNAENFDFGGNNGAVSLKVGPDAQDVINEVSCDRIQY